jgi:hemerythrin superfamily protein
VAQGTSVIELLLRDHRKAEHLLEQLDLTTSNDLAEYFCNLREELVRHEVAEELIVYPAFRKIVQGSDPIADSCIAEQAKAEESLASLEKEDPTSSSFRSGLEELRRAVIAHALHEEADVFPSLQRDTDSAELANLGDRYEKALDSAPTHPHPHAPDTPPANRIMGPMAALVDRVRDAMRHAA